MKNFEVEWAGHYPCLCFGEWKIKYQGKELELPKDIKDSEMNTYGTYQRWYFDDDYMEQFESYEDGLNCDDWIEENKVWINELFDKYNIPRTQDLYEELYNSINAEDFRSGSCGGCI